jgi:hypothetical protein
MLGNHADYFMLAQMREKVHAIGPNAGGSSLSIRDRERPGAAHVTVRDGFGMPGPQRVVNTGFVPGIGCVAPPPPLPSGAIPGMGGGALPGMSGSALPGMGELSNSNLLLGVGAAVALWWAMGRKKA